jgi:hypothetical protein
MLDRLKGAFAPFDSHNFKPVATWSRRRPAAEGRESDDTDSE